MTASLAKTASMLREPVERPIQNGVGRRRKRSRTPKRSSRAMTRQRPEHRENPVRNAAPEQAASLLQRSRYRTGVPIALHCRAKATRPLQAGRHGPSLNPHREQATIAAQPAGTSSQRISMSYVIAPAPQPSVEVRGSATVSRSGESSASAAATPRTRARWAMTIASRAVLLPRSLPDASGRERRRVALRATHGKFHHEGGTRRRTRQRRYECACRESELTRLRLCHRHRPHAATCNQTRRTTAAPGTRAKASITPHRSARFAR